MKLRLWVMTPHHDWFADECAMPRHILAALDNTGVIGRLEWLRHGREDRLRNTEPGSRLLDNLLRRPPYRDDTWLLEAGQASGTAWHLTLKIRPYDPEIGRIYGFSSFNLEFDADPFASASQSDRLDAAFRAACTPKTADYAYIHPNERQSELAAIGGAYESPVVSAPMFSGIYWLNFLGPGQLEEFDLAALGDLGADGGEWVGRDALYLRTADDPAEALRPEAEARMVALTDRFRAACLD